MLSASRAAATAGWSSRFGRSSSRSITRGRGVQASSPKPYASPTSYTSARRRGSSRTGPAMRRCTGARVRASISRSAIPSAARLPATINAT